MMADDDEEQSGPYRLLIETWNDCVFVLSMLGEGMDRLDLSILCSVAGWHENEAGPLVRDIISHHKAVSFVTVRKRLEKLLKEDLLRKRQDPRHCRQRIIALSEKGGQTLASMGRRTQDRKRQLQRQAAAWPAGDERVVLPAERDRGQHDQHR